MCPERYFEKEQSGDKVSLIDKDENNIRTESLTKVGFRSFYKIVNKKNSKVNEQKSKKLYYNTI